MIGAPSARSPGVNLAVMLLAAVRHGGHSFSLPAADGPLPSRRADAAADRNSSAAPGRGARRVLALATQRLAIARSHSTDTRKVDADIEASLDPWSYCSFAHCAC